MHHLFTQSSAVSSQLHHWYRTFPPIMGHLYLKTVQINTSSYDSDQSGWRSIVGHHLASLIGPDQNAVTWSPARMCLYLGAPDEKVWCGKNTIGRFKLLWQEQFGV